MDRKSKFLFSALILAIIFVGVYKYKEFVIDKNFDIYTHISCNPQTEECFVQDCSIETDPECDLNPYKKITKSAKNILECVDGADCPELKCEQNEEFCEITVCSEASIEDGEVCTEIPSLFTENIEESATSSVSDTETN
jgi:hypothetical protein